MAEGRGWPADFAGIRDAGVLGYALMMEWKGRSTSRHRGLRRRSTERQGQHSRERYVRGWETSGS